MLKLNLVHIILSIHVYFSVHVLVLKEDKVYQHIVLESKGDRYVLIQGSGTVIVNESLDSVGKASVEVSWMSCIVMY